VIFPLFFFWPCTPVTRQNRTSFMATAAPPTAKAKQLLPCESFPFWRLCEQLQKCADAKASDRRLVIENLWRQLGRDSNGSLCSLYPLIRILLPHVRASPALLVSWYQVEHAHAILN
jgi:hypothetical protein